ncbi:MAG: DUF4870 domain-containing protein [bacterium]
MQGAYCLFGQNCYHFLGLFLTEMRQCLNIVVVIIATITANEGKQYRYPLTIRFIR